MKASLLLLKRALLQALARIALLLNGGWFSLELWDKWITENDRSLSTTMWLTYERLNRECVRCLKCSVCVRFQDKLMTCRNYSSAFIEGSKNLRSSAFKDHAKSDMHQRAMLLLRKASAKTATDYSPIASV